MAAVQTMREPLRVFIGYDGRPNERIAYQVCAKSLLDWSTIPLAIEPLDERRLRHAGLYRREWKYEGGQYIDMRDNRPYSTEFAFSRFLVPTLCQWHGRAVFCDCDFLWRGNIAELVDLFDERYAVQVVQHVHEPTETTKMEGAAQTRYLRKNWSSLVMWNAGHKANLMLTPHRVNMERGQWLHALIWCEPHEIGALPVEWNYLVNTTTREQCPDPKAVHFTDGIPTMPGRAEDEYADDWRDVAKRITA